MMTEVHCVHCGHKCEVRLKPDGSAVRDCAHCGGNPLPMDILLVNLDIGTEDMFVCPKCNKLHTGDSFCWSCGHKMGS